MCLDKKLASSDCAQPPLASYVCGLVCKLGIGDHASLRIIMESEFRNRGLLSQSWRIYRSQSPVEGEINGYRVESERHFHRDWRRAR